jgi:hypothetical protein
LGVLSSLDRAAVGEPIFREVERERQQEIRAGLGRVAL